MSDAPPFDPFGDAYHRLPYLEVRFQLSRADLFAVLYWQTRRASSRREKFAHFALNSAVFIGVSILSAAIAGYALSIISEMSRTIGEKYPAMVFIILFGLSYIFITLLVRTFGRAVYAGGLMRRGAAYREKVALRLTDAGIWSRASFGASFYAWVAVKIVERIKAGIILYVEDGAIFLVPSSAFEADAELMQFLQFALARQHAIAPD